MSNIRNYFNHSFTCLQYNNVSLSNRYFCRQMNHIVRSSLDLLVVADLKDFHKHKTTDLRIKLYIYIS